MKKIALAVASRWVIIVFPKPHTWSTRRKMAAWARDIGVSPEEFKKFVNAVLDKTVEAAFEKDPERVYVIAKGILRKWLLDPQLSDSSGKYRQTLQEIARDLGILFDEFRRSLVELFKQIIAENTGTLSRS
jgi:Sec-independent protein translocase protein TatA